MKPDYHPMQLFADKNTLERSASGAITSVIYFEFGSVKFPENGWSDFSIVILGWWLENALKLMTGKSMVEEFLFMEGSLLLRVTVREKDVWLLECIDSTHDNLVEYSQTISSYELISNLLKVATDMLMTCEKQGWKSPDIDKIDKLVRIQPAEFKIIRHA